MGCLDKHVKEYEVKCKYHWDIVQNMYENLMMLHTWIPCGKDLFNMGIYGLIQTKIYFTACISMYVKPSIPACMLLILQRTLTAVVMCDLSIETEPWFCAWKFEKSSEIVIHTSNNHKDGISEVWQLFLAKLNKYYSLNYHSFHWKLLTHYLQNKLSKIFPICTYLCSYIVYI